MVYRWGDINVYQQRQGTGLLISFNMLNGPLHCPMASWYYMKCCPGVSEVQALNKPWCTLTPLGIDVTCCPVCRTSIFRVMWQACIVKMLVGSWHRSHQNSFNARGCKFSGNCLNSGFLLRSSGSLPRSALYKSIGEHVFWQYNSPVSGISVNAHLHPWML